MNDPKGYRIEPFEPTELAPAQLREAALFQQALEHERVVEDPLMVPEAIEARMLAISPGRWRAFFGARDQSGAIVGYSVVGWEKNEPGNQHMRWCEVAVAPAHRRRGLGRSLLRRAVQAVADQREDLLFISQFSDRIPAAAGFARSMGATPGLEMKMNQLDLGAVDRVALLGPQHARPGRAPGQHQARQREQRQRDRPLPTISTTHALSQQPRVLED